MESTYLVANNLIARVSRMFLLHRTNSCLMGFGGLAAAKDLNKINNSQSEILKFNL